MCTCRPLRPLPLPPWSRSGLWGWAEWAWGWHHSWRPGRRCKPPTKGAIKGQGRVARHYILQLTSSRGALYSNLRYCLHLLRGLFEYSVNIISRRWRGALQWLFVTVRATAGDSSKKKKKKAPIKGTCCPSSPLSTHSPIRPGSLAHTARLLWPPQFISQNKKKKTTSGRYIFVHQPLTNCTSDWWQSQMVKGAFTKIEKIKVDIPLESQYVNQKTKLHI